MFRRYNLQKAKAKAKAFDCVDRATLIKKLEQIGIRGNTLKLFHSYINDRDQVVQINNSQRDLKKTKYGIAQESRLGPLLFLIYVNDIFELKLNGKLQLYADDSSITYIENDLETLHKSITEDLLIISDWFKNNLLVLNASKTKILFFNSNQKILSKFQDIYLKNSKITAVSENKY